MNHTILSFLFLFILLNPLGKVRSQDMQPDVTGYHLSMEPNIYDASIKGSVAIYFLINKEANSVEFHAGQLTIDKLTGKDVKDYRKTGEKLIVYLSKRNSLGNKIIVDYHGRPNKGLIFDKENNQAYTNYFTSEWMICNDSPEDKATLRLDIIAPNDKICIASGELIQKEKQGDKTRYSYQLQTEAPSYTYGFALGAFKEAEEKYHGRNLRYYSLSYSSEQMQDIFKETPNMLSFFEEKSGLTYFQSTYSQVLIGDYFQEMSGFSALRDSYGKMVLADSIETNLISHELAHQWWGNRITCKGWGHFWLNEGIATFMSAAYNEYRFGRKVYLANIESYRKVYDGIKKRGNDRSLVFEDWNNPSKDDRNLVYFKGAYVIHLLKEKLGDTTFWDAICFYSQQHMGQTVETADFHRAMEESSGHDLSDFFNTWVYK